MDNSQTPKSFQPQDLQLKNKFTKTNATIKTSNDIEIICKLISQLNQNSVVVGSTKIASLVHGKIHNLQNFRIWILTKSKAQQNVPNLLTQLQKNVQSLSKLPIKEIRDSLGEMIKLKYPNYQRQLFIWGKGKMEITAIYGQVRAMAKFVSNDAADYGADILVILT